MSTPRGVLVRKYLPKPMKVSAPIAEYVESARERLRKGDLYTWPMFKKTIPQGLHGKYKWELHKAWLDIQHTPKKIEGKWGPHGPW